jgi:predicted molibdopterin-dependent oxidoreductase YjgC
MTLGEARREQDFGAGRIDTHPILGDLLAAPFVTFTFDGLPVQGRQGEPIAASLLAAGIRIFRMMPRFGGARGGFCMIGRCTDCLVVVDGVPNVHACVTPVAADISVRSQRGLGDEDERQLGERRA